MRNPFGKIAIGCVLALALMGSAAYAQALAPAAPKGSVVVASPTYTSIAMEITVNRPAAEVWKRIGGYCDVGEWLQIPAGCKIISGKDGEFGAVRSVAAAKCSWAERSSLTPMRKLRRRVHHTTSTTARSKRGH